MGLSGPLIVFAFIGAAVLAAVVTRLPDDTPKSPARGQIVGEPSIGGVHNRAALTRDDHAAGPFRSRHPRVFPWHMIGALGGHGPAALLGDIGSCGRESSRAKVCQYG